MSQAAADRSFLTCPACGQIVGIPTSAFGRMVVCPHCQTSFRVRFDDAEQLSVDVPEEVKSIPRPLLVPIYGLMLLGVSGLFVGVMLLQQFLRHPGADYDYAYARVIEMRTNINSDRASKPTDDEWEHISSAAVVGPAAAIHGAPIIEEVKNKELAAAWQPAIVPTTVGSLMLSLLTLAGGISMIAGRWYPLAFIGCIAAIVNVNYLCCLPGAVAGIWGIVMLVRDEVRPHFGITSTTAMRKN